MALIMDQQPDFKHFCKVCKKGFGCGRALGGHMRAHGIGDESGHLDDEDPASDWEAKFGATDVSATSNKRMYALRTNPNRLKSCRVCENCGKEFLSWKSFLEHGKCSSDDAESLVSSPAGSDDAEYGGGARRGCGNWSKRKRSLRAQVGNFSSNCPSSEEEDLANCLMMLSNANVDPNSVAEPEESCASASKEDQERRNPMNFMAPLACKTPITYNKAKGVANKGLFECKACKKVFNSHQALGGHRASHKKVKGCFAARLDQGLDDSAADHEDAVTEEAFFPSKSTPTFQFDHNSSDASASKRKSKVHECSICHRVFSSGQALGGHKRCHWITSNSLEASSLAKFHQFQDHTDQIQQTPKFIDYPETLDLTLDLNLPAAAPPDDHTGGAARDNAANPASLEISTEIYLQSWVGVDVKERDDNDHHNQLHKDHQNDEDGHKNNDNNNTDNNNKNNDNIVNNNSSNGSVKNAGNEADSRLELAKLSELKDVSGNSSPWLNVGIGSTAGVSVDP